MNMKNKKLLLTIIPIILFILIAIYIKAGLVSNFDNFIYGKLTSNMNDTLSNIIIFITHLGDTIVVILFCFVLLLIKKTRIKFGIPISLALIISAILNNLLKIIFIRERPNILRLINETNYSFPSGHAMNNACLYTMIIILINKYISNKKIKITITIISIMMPIIIGLSRVYIGVHYITDVIGGWILGSTLAIFSYYLYNHLTKKNKTN